MVAGFSLLVTPLSARKGEGGSGVRVGSGVGSGVGGI